MKKRIGLLVGLYVLVWVAPLCAQAGEDCRVKLADLQPLIKAFNPYFTEHRWDDELKVERAVMDKNRKLIITQDGCKRKQMSFILYLNPNIVKPEPEFWIGETESLFRAVFYEDRTFRRFQQEFEETFAAKFLEYGIGEGFDFPLGIRNFICRVDAPPGKDAAIQIEMLEYVFEEAVKEARKPNTQDDGWFGR